MKYISLLFLFIIFSIVGRCQWKGKNDTTKIVGLICKDQNCSDARFFRGYLVSYIPTKREIKYSSNLIVTKDLPEDQFLDEQKKVIDVIPITFFCYEWK